MIKPWFFTEGKLLLYSSYLHLGVPNWTVIYINTAATSKHHEDVILTEEDQE
jgi:hypothetical protein